MIYHYNAINKKEARHLEKRFREHGFLTTSSRLQALDEFGSVRPSGRYMIYVYSPGGMSKEDFNAECERIKENALREITPEWVARECPHI